MKGKGWFSVDGKRLKHCANIKDQKGDVSWAGLF